MDLGALVHALVSSRSFEGAAQATLHAMLAAVDRAIGESPFAGRARLLRAMAHHRPGNGYRRLYVVEHNPLARAERVPYVPSATAWRWVSDRGCAVSIDVPLALLHLWVRTPPEVVGDGVSLFTDQQSRQTLLERETTHVHVVPLRVPGGAIDGMIAIEASCPDALGDAFVWGRCLEELQILADVGAPYLAALRCTETPAVRPDELLPVVGAATAPLVELLRVFAQQEETILLAGPTGVGKSRLARWCHAQSRRAGQRFETLDLLTVPEELQMGELFGWRRGAFTGALKDNPGCIARAERGTLFLDEIDKLSPKAQAGLLRVLEERTYRSMGDDKADRRADLRFIIGTNVDLRESIRKGRFREDLYYRINVLPIRVPPLAERTDELVAWANYMLQRRHHDGGGEGTAHLSRDAESLLLRTEWPGNLRQLDNMIRRAYAIALRGHGAPPRDMVLHREHFEYALTYEEAPSAAPPSKRLQAAADAFVVEAERNRESGHPLRMDLADGFRGLVLRSAIQRMGGREQAFRLFGAESLVQSRNHHKVARRELERARELLVALDGTPLDSIASGSEPPLAMGESSSEESPESRPLRTH